MSEEIIQDGLWYLLARFYGFEDTVLNKVAICKTLKDAGISDTDKGVLIQMEDGSEFQLIIKQTAKYDPAYYERPDTPIHCCLLYTSPSPRDRQKSRMPSSA